MEQSPWHFQEAARKPVWLEKSERDTVMGKVPGYLCSGALEKTWEDDIEENLQN